MAHYADCEKQRFPADGGIEEGCLAEFWCFNKTQDARKAVQ
jgi:hypothetical protein